MGFLAGVLLLYMTEEETFWVLAALLKGVVHEPMEGLFEDGLPLIQQYFYQFEGLVKAQLPKLGAHMDQEGIHPSIYASQWFITVYAHSFPFRVVVRIWDILFLEGIKIAFRIGLQLLKDKESELLQLSFEPLVNALRSMGSETLDPDVLIGNALKLRVSTQLRELREQYERSK